ncbi:hypothetical protein RA280_47275, partial [Cupriavidus sp. CV2]|uniref:hypothetical protein n=1 Tax=Cupriavidus ulmosensis TaxID=3065913 RepID=UPI00296B37F6
MNTAQPGLEIGEYKVNDRQEGFGHLHVSALRDGDKLSTKSESVVCPESLKDYIDISFKGFGVAGLEGQPLVFHLVP